MNGLVKQWITALRSGKYRQGRTYLRCNDRFCVYGVLCDLYNPSQWQHEYSGVYRYGIYTSGIPCYILAEVRPVKDNLTFLNDNGVPFEHLADIIEGWYNEPVR